MFHTMRPTINVLIKTEYIKICLITIINIELNKDLKTFQCRYVKNFCSINYITYIV